MILKRQHFKNKRYLFEYPKLWWQAYFPTFKDAMDCFDATYEKINELLPSYMESKFAQFTDINNVALGDKSYFKLR